MMKDNHVAGEGNAYYTLFREYDPDLGRWWRPDPIFQPWQSPYSAFDGNPIMFTDVWGLEAEEKKAPPKGSEQNPYRLPEVTKIDDAPEGTRKIEYVSGYSMPIYLAKHDGKWISATEYGGKMENLVNNLNNKDYDPSSDGFNLDEPLSDSFFSEFATRASRQWGNQSHLLNKIFEKGGYRNPFFSGHGLEDNSQEIVGYVGGGLSIARGLFKKAFGWLAGKSAATLSVEAVEAAAKDLVSLNEKSFVKTIRNPKNKKIFLKELAENDKTPSWMKPWLKQGKNPPGYDVDHVVPLSIGGKDNSSNMRLVLRKDHKIHHKYYRPWRK